MREELVRYGVKYSFGNERDICELFVELDFDGHVADVKNCVVEK